MGKTAATAMSYEKTPQYVNRPKATLQVKSLYRETNDINLMPWHEVLRRLYKRHSVGAWQTVTFTTWAVGIWSIVN